MADSRLELYKSSLVSLLITGGDERIAISPLSNANKYGFPTTPELGVPAFGSCTASTISPNTFLFVERLWNDLQKDLQTQSAPMVYAREMDRLRSDLRELLDIDHTDVIFADSGTTLHLLAGQLCDRKELCVIVMDPAETGRGVPNALAGLHFSACMPLGGESIAGEPLSPSGAIPIIAIPLRDADGSPRPSEAIDADTEIAVLKALSAGQNILINTVDVSKTGLIAPSAECAIRLQQIYPDRIKCLIDACQFRMTRQTLRAYLGQGCMVAITGSKFMAGPSFSGALLVPETIAERLRDVPLPAAVGLYSAKAEWPEGWWGNRFLPDKENYGLLLRWRAALTEMRPFFGQPDQDVEEFCTLFAKSISGRLDADPALEALPVPALKRLSRFSWDAIQTIFPFILRGPDGAVLDRETTKRVYEQAGAGPERCRIGQPVECGVRQHKPVNALRLCLSAPLIVDALMGRSPDAVIAEALSVLDRLVMLARTAEY